MTATRGKPDLSLPLRPLTETAAEFRHECVALDQLVEELYRDIERLRDELVRKADDIEEARRKLSDNRRQLAEQRKDSGQMLALLQQQEARASEALNEIKSLREQLAREREDSLQREELRFTELQQKIQATETERDQLRQELSAIRAAGNGNSESGAEAFAPFLSVLPDMRQQLQDTQAQLAETRTQMAEAIQKAASIIQEAPAQAATSAAAGDPEVNARLADSERQRFELEAELELVRTRASELQEVVNQQRRDLSEQRADVTDELRLLRELVEQRQELHRVEHHSAPEPAVEVAASAAAQAGAAADPVVSSVMAQFARLQKDVAQRRKKK